MRSKLLGGRYRLGPVIGVGGTGTVHRARDERSGRDVAVKVLRAGAAPADCERLRREAEYLGAVRHPNLVAVLDGGADAGEEWNGGVAWFAMELVPGPDLGTLLRERGPMDGAGVRRLLVGVLGALGAMHEAGLVHRDVTPSNILLTAPPFARWQAKLTDLGIARRARSTPITGAGRVVGTAAYLSPEQVVGGDVGPATDVYALALVAVEALTGATPFPGSPIESATSRLLRPPALPADLDPAWRALLAAATSMEAAERPDAAACLAAVLELPEDAGVRPVRSDTPQSILSGAPAAGRSAAEDVGRTAEASAQRATAALPVFRSTTAARTAELAVRRQPRRRSPIAVLVVAAAVLLGAGATIGTAALVGSHVLTSAVAAAGRPAVATATPTAPASAVPSASASAPASAAEGTTSAAQADAAPPDQTDAVALPGQQAGPAIGGVAPAPPRPAVPQERGDAPGPGGVDSGPAALILGPPVVADRGVREGLVGGGIAGAACRATVLRTHRLG